MGGGGKIEGLEWQSGGDAGCIVKKDSQVASLRRWEFSRLARAEGMPHAALGVKSSGGTAARNRAVINNDRLLNK